MEREMGNDMRKDLVKTLEWVNKEILQSNAPIYLFTWLSL